MQGQKVPNQERYYQFVQSYIGGLRDGIPAIEAQLAHLDGAKKAAARSRLAGLRSYFAEMSGFAPALPNITFDRELRLHCGDVTVDVRHRPRAYSR